ncbi:MAG TPA: [LysW]-lysine hydrolase [Deinococcales bacterium]|nr:[LysW]-lysine hydrolase [Deinococcales bacterium]
MSPTPEPDRDAALELLRGAVERASLSGQEGEVARFLVERMQALGLNARVDEAGNAVGETGTGPVQVVLLGHIDTVPGSIPVRVQDGELWGRGSVDAKGPFCTFVMAAAGLAAPVLERLRVTVIGAVEEEAPTSKGARHVAPLLQPDHCIIGEPSAWDAVTLGYKGRLVVKARVEKANFHSAGDDTTAAEDLVAFWNALKAWADARNAASPRVFDAVQLALQGISSSGDGLTQSADATIGLRLPPSLGPREAQAAVEDLAGGRVNLVFTGHEVPYRGPKDTPLTRAFRAAIRAEGGEPTLKLKTGTSDMNVVAAHWNCPMLAYGPGDSSLDHRPDERLNLDDYRRAIRVLRGALTRLAERQG